MNTVTEDAWRRLPPNNRIAVIHGARLAGFVVDLEFCNGVRGGISLAHIFDNAEYVAAEVLARGEFEKCFIDGWALGWPCGFDLCQDALYLWLLEQREQRARVG